MSKSYCRYSTLRWLTRWSSSFFRGGRIVTLPSHWGAPLGRSGKASIRLPWAKPGWLEHVALFLLPSVLGSGLPLVGSGTSILRDVRVPGWRASVVPWLRAVGGHPQFSLVPPVVLLQRACWKGSEIYQHVCGQDLPSLVAEVLQV